MASIARELLRKIGFAHGHWNHFHIAVLAGSSLSSLQFAGLRIIGNTLSMPVNYLIR